MLLTLKKFKEILENYAQNFLEVLKNIFEKYV
jgi:hypothetical protein